MTNETAGLSLQEAFRQAEEEVQGLSEPSPEADTEGSLPEPEPQGEQPAVENTGPVGLFDDEDSGEEGLEEQPEVQDSHEVTVDGETLLVDTAELRSGYMRQADYTRKTQELADRERQVDNAIALKEMLETQPHETLRKLYQRINTGKELDFLGEKSPSNVQETKDPGDIEALVEARVSELLESDPRIQEFQRTQAVSKIESIFTKIEDDYGVELVNSDKQKVLEKAQEMGTSDLETVFGAMYAKQLAAQRQRDQEKANLKRVSSLKGEGRVDEFNPQTPSSPKKYDSFRSALDEELRLMEQEGNAFSS